MGEETGREAVGLRAERDETCHPDFGHARFQGCSAARGADLWVWGHGGHDGLQTLVLPPALMRAQAEDWTIRQSSHHLAHTFTVVLIPPAHSSHSVPLSTSTLTPTLPPWEGAITTDR